jgi:hypothetical protein
MATLASLAGLPLYQEGYNFSEVDHVRGDRVEFWLADLSFGASTPTAKTITADAAALVDAETLSLKVASGTHKVYRGDVLWFDADDTLAVIAATTTIASTATTVPILPLMDGITDEATALSYGLKPLLSLMEGGIPESSGTEVTSRNKGQNLHSAKAIFGRDSTINLSGTVVRSDEALAIIAKKKRGSSLIYFESRYAPYENFSTMDANWIYGAGISAERGVAFVNNFTPTSGMDFQKITATLSISGAPTPYYPLGYSPT